MKRVLIAMLAIPSCLVLLLGLTFVLGQVQLSWQSFPPANAEPNWQRLGQEEIPSVVTIDADGSRRITEVWIATVDDLPYLRTGNTKWFANLQRAPELELRIGGAMYRCGTNVVLDDAMARVVHDAFYAKYPRRTEFFRMIGVSTNTVLALECGEES